MLTLVTKFKGKCILHALIINPVNRGARTTICKGTAKSVSKGSPRHFAICRGEDGTFGQCRVEPGCESQGVKPESQGVKRP